MCPKTPTESDSSDDIVIVDTAPFKVTSFLPLITVIYEAFPVGPGLHR
jgi:hypothetical protein